MAEALTVTLSTIRRINSFPSCGNVLPIPQTSGMRVNSYDADHIPTKEYALC